MATRELIVSLQSIGIARRSIEIMQNYSNERSAFGKKISEFGQTQKAIAEVSSER